MHVQRTKTDDADVLKPFPRIAREGPANFRPRVSEAYVDTFFMIRTSFSP